MSSFETNSSPVARYTVENNNHGPFHVASQKIFFRHAEKFYLVKITTQIFSGFSETPHEMMYSE